MTLLGGMGTVFGPIVGAFALVTLQSQLADKVGSMVTVIMGGMFIVCVLLFRGGNRRAKYPGCTIALWAGGRIDVGPTNKSARCLVSLRRD